MADEAIQITKLPQRSTLLFDGNPVALNDVIKVDDQNLISLENTTGYRGMPFDFFNYKIINDEIESKESTVTCNFETGGEMDITETGDTVHYLDEEFFFDDYVPYDESWDRITIESITGKGQWILGKRSDGVQIFPDQLLEEGKTYMCYDIHNLLRFVPSTAKAISVYNTLTFKKETKTNIGDLSTFEFNCKFYALQQIMNEGYFFINENGDYNFYFETRVYNTVPEVDATIEIDTTALLQLSADPDNYLNITTIDGLDETITTPGVNAISPALNEEGETLLRFALFIKGNVAISEPIDVTLTHIDGSTSNIDASTQTLTINTLAT